jgi:hypothetical protein
MLRNGSVLLKAALGVIRTRIDDISRRGDFMFVQPGDHFVRTVEREINTSVSPFRTRTADQPSLRTDLSTQPGICPASSHETAFIVFSFLIGENYFRPPTEFAGSAISLIGGFASYVVSRDVRANIEAPGFEVSAELNPEGSRNRGFAIR